MKRIFLILTPLIGIVLFASVSYAAPWLATDLPQTGFTPTQVQVEVTLGTGSPVINLGTRIISGVDYEIYDLAPLVPGAYKFRARWADVSGWWSDWTPFLNAVKPTAPTGSRVVP